MLIRFYIECDSYITNIVISSLRKKLVYTHDDEVVKKTNIDTLFEFYKLKDDSTQNMFFQPIVFNSQGFYYGSKHKVSVNFIKLNSTFLLCRFPFNDEENKVHETLLEKYFSTSACLHKYRLSEIFEPIKCLADTGRIINYDYGYRVLREITQGISEKILNDFRSTYPDEVVEEEKARELPDHILGILEQHVKNKSKSIKNIIFQMPFTPINLRFNRFTKKLDRLLVKYSIFSQYSSIEFENTKADKKVKKFLLNLAISGFIRAIFPMLWRLLDKDAFKIVIEPTVKYRFISLDERQDMIKQMGLNRYWRIPQVHINHDFTVAFDVKLKISKKIEPVVFIINQSFLAFFMKSRLHIGYFGVLDHMVKIFISKLESTDNVIYSSLSV